MKKLILTINENWKDPVWSNVIATIIIAVGGFIITSLFSLAKSLITDIPFEDVFSEAFIFLNSDIEVKLWLVVLLALVYIILIIKPIILLLNEITAKRINPRKETTITFKELPSATEDSTSFFHYRMASAFPGIRGVKWFDDPKVATKRLAILLQEPLNFSAGSREAESDPIWWFRGGGALCIEKFKKNGSKKVLMNFDQLVIKRIAAFKGDSYYKDFVYVEVEGENQTGLYNHTPADIQRHIDTFGYSWEEYGLIKNRFGWTTPIRREEYDDGATVIRGKVRNAMDADLRVRYLSTYNFIIAAKGSPYNSRKFDRESKEYLNGILRGEVQPEALFEFLNGFEKYEQ